ncbi:MAG: hypothetical protein V4508_10385 [Pseudomonadota bacterium]
MTARTIAIEAAGAGMRLACELADGGGIVLLPAGALLTEANLAALRRRGVTVLQVRTGEAAPEAAPDDAARARLRLAHLFRASAGVGAGDALLARLLHYRSGQ